MPPQDIEASHETAKNDTTESKEGSRSHSGRNILAAIGGVIFAAIWSGSFVATKIALAEIPPLWLVGIRLAAAGLVYSALAFSTHRSLWGKMSNKGRGTLVISGLLSQAFYLGGTCWALTALPTGVVNIIVAGLPLISLMMASILLKERIEPIDIVAAGIGAAGVAMVVIGRDPTLLTSKSALTTPVVLTFATVLGLATGNALIKPYISWHSITSICATQMTLSGVLVLALAARYEDTYRPIASTNSLVALGYLVLVGSIGGTLIWYKVLEIFTAKGAGMFFLFTPIFGLGIGWALLNEEMTWTKAVGAAVVSGSILLRYGFRQKSTRVAMTG